MNLSYNYSEVGVNNIPLCPIPYDIFSVEKLFFISFFISLTLILYWLFIQREILKDQNKYYKAILPPLFLALIILSLAITLNLYFNL